MPSRLKEEEYDRRLATLGKVKRVGPYINSSTSTLHLCLKHGEMLASKPSDLLRGHGLACCSNLGANKKAKSEYDQKNSHIRKCRKSRRICNPEDTYRTQVFSPQ